MDESKRNEIVQLWLGGASRRRIAKILRVSRNSIRKVLSDHEASREGLGRTLQDKPNKPSKLDAFANHIDQLIERYPDITAIRLHEELKILGFTGGYTIVKERLRSLRPHPVKQPVIRFETGPGLQAQMDYSPYTLDFVREGRRRVYAFSYVLAYSRRQYLRFVESQDFETTLREHIRAFDHMEGVARACLYDNMKVVVSHYDGNEPIYNCRFLAFATHYQFRPWACRRYRAQTKGKVERPFSYVEKNLLNARSFNSIEHLNQTAAWWLENVADVRFHRETKKRPFDLHREEIEHLMPLPKKPYDVAHVVYRIVNSESCVHWLQNFYPVPANLIGWMVPVKITENEVVIYGRDLTECARHPLFPRSVTGQKVPSNGKYPRPEGKQSTQALRERFCIMGTEALKFLDGMLETRRYGKRDAIKVLALMQTWEHDDIVSAIARAVRYKAYSPTVIERILSAQATPRSPLNLFDAKHTERLSRISSVESVEPRPTSAYQSLLDNSHDSDGGAPIGPDQRKSKD